MLFHPRRRASPRRFVQRAMAALRARARVVIDCSAPVDSVRPLSVQLTVLVGFYRYKSAHRSERKSLNDAPLCG